MYTKAGTNHQAEHEQAGSSSVSQAAWLAGWVSLLLASGAPGFMVSLACLAGRQNCWACGAIDERWECTGRPPLFPPGWGS
jgi:hypothetical protein